MLDPATKLVTFFRNDARGLMREIGADVAVDEDNFAVVEGCFNLGLGLEAVASIEQRSEMRIHGFERAEFAIEKLPDHFAEPGVILRKSGGMDAVPAFASGNGAVQQIHLRAFTAAIDAFDGDEPAEGSSIHIWTQSNLISRITHNYQGSQVSLTAGVRPRNAAHARMQIRRRNGSMIDQGQIRESILRVQERIAAAARKAGRRSEEITLVGVSKTHPAEAIRAAYEAGVRHFGENRVQEWEGKRAALGDLQATWHLVGHLQSNKAARAAGSFHSVDSVDDFALAQRLDRARDGQSNARKLRVLLEVRVEEEESKSGVRAEEAAALAEKVAALSHIELAGLMCIPPFLEDADKVRPYFRRLRELRDALVRKIGHELPVLSMGMSHDFEVAIEEGATEVRVGTALFGSRKPL
jgi:PLP dependent protein